jgi:hypothetical protein
MIIRALLEIKGYVRRNLKFIRSLSRVTCSLQKNLQQERFRIPIHIYIYIKTLYDMIYLSTAIGLTPGGSGTVHIYLQTMKLIN